MKFINDKNPAVLSHHQIRTPDGLILSLHEKRPRHPYPKPRAILLIHSATFSSIPEYDLQVKDYSLMDFFVKNGYNVFALDIRGYGDSQSPPSDVWITADLAESDVKSAVDFIRSSLGVPSVDILGWSWGTQVAGLYAQNNPTTVGNLVLYAPFWNGVNVDVPEPQATRQKNDREFVISDFLDAARVDAEVVKTFVEQCLKYDETSPRGSWRDMKNLNKKPILEPEKLTMPTLLIYGEHDHLLLKDDINRFFDCLPAREKRMVIIPNTDHMAHLELNHEIFQTAVNAFLMGNRMRTPKPVGVFGENEKRNQQSVFNAQLKLQVDVSFEAHYKFLIKHGLKQTKRVLDVGTGNGYFCARLAELHPRTHFVGLENMSSMISYARDLMRERGTQNFDIIEGNILDERLQYSEPFDGVLVRYTAYHIPEIKKALNIMWRLLKPDGKLWIIDEEFDYMYSEPEAEGFILYKKGTEKLYNKFGSDCHMGSKLPGLLTQAGYKVLSFVKDPMSNCEIGTENFQRYVLHEATLIHLTDSTAISGEDMKVIEKFVNEIVPQPDFYGAYGHVMIAAER